MSLNNQPDYRDIVAHYEACLEQYGDTHQGVDWPKPEDAATRYGVMLDLLKFDPASSPGPDKTLLDFGCGAAHLLEYILKQQIQGVQYSGLDLSQKFVDLCVSKFPGSSFYCADILKEDTQLPLFDYIVMNGVFTEKRALSFAEMFGYFRNLLIKAFPMVNRGIAFNVMSKAVDWEREDLFHLPLDLLQQMLVKDISRNFIIRNDYRLYEYTVYVYR